jgi:hypothetical protein
MAIGAIKFPDGYIDAKGPPFEFDDRLRPILRLQRCDRQTNLAISALTLSGVLRHEADGLDWMPLDPRGMGDE